MKSIFQLSIKDGLVMHFSTHKKALVYLRGHLKLKDQSPVLWHQGTSSVTKEAIWVYDVYTNDKVTCDASDSATIREITVY